MFTGSHFVDLHVVMAVELVDGMVDDLTVVHGLLALEEDLSHELVDLSLRLLLGLCLVYQDTVVDGVHLRQRILVVEMVHFIFSNLKIVFNFLNFR